MLLGRQKRMIAAKTMRKPDHVWSINLSYNSTLDWRIIIVEKSGPRGRRNMQLAGMQQLTMIQASEEGITHCLHAQDNGRVVVTR